MAIKRVNRDIVIIDGYGNLYVLYPSTNSKAVIVDPTINEAVLTADMTTLEDVLAHLGKLGMKSYITLEDLDESIFAVNDGSDEDAGRLATQQSIEKINLSIDGLKKVIEELPTMETIKDLSARIMGLEVTPTMLRSSGEGFSSICSWQDGNPANANRAFKFVTYATSNDSKLVKIASRSGNTGDIICGVSAHSTGVLSNMKDEFVLDDGSLVRSAVPVTVCGPAYVIDSGLCTPGGYCVCDENGNAVNSEDGVGYYVISRYDGETILINFTPGLETTLGLQSQIDTLKNSVDKITKILDEYPEITSGTSDPTGGKSGDVYIKYAP